MLKAFQYGKIKSETKEDSLTASVFQLLSYLPTSLMVRILRESIYGEEFPFQTGELLSISFWDKWKMEEEDINESFVEPDVFLSFEKINLIVEAKRWDDKQQDCNQWKKELQGYFNEYGEDTRPVYLLALGGINKEITETVKVKETKEITILKCRWKRLLDNIAYHKNEMEKLKNPTPIQLNWKRIFYDLIKSFELHKFPLEVWFTDELRLRKLLPNPSKMDLFINSTKLWHQIKSRSKS